MNNKPDSDSVGNIDSVSILVDPPDPAFWLSINADADRRVAWANSVLELDPRTDSKTDREQALVRFFSFLTRDNSFIDIRRLTATRILMGKVERSLNEPKAYLDELVREQLKQIDRIVYWYAHQIGDDDATECIKELTAKLEPFSGPETHLRVKRFAQHVLQIAKGTKPLKSDESLLTRQLSQAIFQINATSPDRRLHVQRTLISLLRERYSTSELNLAGSILRSRYQLHDSPLTTQFIRRLSWTDRDTEEFRLTFPGETWAAKDWDSESRMPKRQHRAKTSDEEPPAFQPREIRMMIYLALFFVTASIICGVITSMDALNHSSPKTTDPIPSKQDMKKWAERTKALDSEAFRFLLDPANPKDKGSFFPLRDSKPDSVNKERKNKLYRPKREKQEPPNTQ